MFPCLIAACRVHSQCSLGSIPAGVRQMDCRCHPYLHLPVESENLPATGSCGGCHRNFQTVAKAENDEDGQASDLPICLCPDHLQVCPLPLLWCVPCMCYDVASVPNAWKAAHANAALQVKVARVLTTTLQAWSATLHSFCHQDCGDPHYLCTRRALDEWSDLASGS